MAEWVEIKAKSVDKALTEALVNFRTTIDNIEYEVIEKESTGLFGLFGKPAKIKVRCKEKKEIKDPIKTKEEVYTNESVSGENIKKVASNFLEKLFHAMNINATIFLEYDEREGSLNITMHGDNMGILIGKRGQTLDSLQYLTSLVVNKEISSYVKVKLDTENYRERRKETLENLSKNIAYKVKRTKQSVSLEPMNPYERRIIHSALQYDKVIDTHSEGDEPYRYVVISLKKGYKDYNHTYNSKPYNKGYKNNGVSEKKNVE